MMSSRVYLNQDPNQQSQKQNKQLLSQKCIQIYKSTDGQVGGCLNPGELYQCFFRKYNKKFIRSFTTQELMENFNVKKRRIYDLLNILQGCGSIQRISKGTFEWATSPKLPQLCSKERDPTSLRLVSTKIKLIFLRSNGPLSFAEIYTQLLGKLQKCQKLEMNPLSAKRRIYECLRLFKLLNLVEKVEDKYAWRENVDKVSVEKIKLLTTKPKHLNRLREQIRINEICSGFQTSEQMQSFISRLRKKFNRQNKSE